MSDRSAILYEATHGLATVSVFTSCSVISVTLTLPRLSLTRIVYLMCLVSASVVKLTGVVLSKSWIHTKSVMILCAMIMLSLSAFHSSTWIVTQSHPDNQSVARLSIRANALYSVLGFTSSICTWRISTYSHTADPSYDVMSMYSGLPEL